MSVTITISNKKRLFYYVSGVVIVFLLGLLFGSSLESKRYNAFLSGTVPIRDNGSSLKFVNPLLGISSPAATTINVFTPIKSKLESMRQLAEDKGEIDDAAIYFRDLNSTFWFGIDEDVNYITASLFKLPVALAAYRQGEADPRFFSEKIYYTSAISKLNDPAQGAATTTLVVGQGYSVKDLIESMLILSDNGAKDLLIASVDKKYIDEVFAFSALLEPDFEKQYSLSPKNYSIFFRLLYSSTFLSGKNSNELLEILSLSTFRDGIVAGVDSSVPVAHKFGVYVLNRATADTPGKEELHDCGIVYHPRHPYVLCVMTKGDNDAHLKAFISQISKVVYINVGSDYDK